MARSSVKFSSGGKLTDVGRAVKNLTRRMSRYAQRTGATIDTKHIRNQVRSQIERGMSTKDIISVMEKVRDDRIKEVAYGGKGIKDNGRYILTASELERLNIILDNITGEWNSANDVSANVLQEVFDSAINIEGKEVIEQRLQDNASEINEALEYLIYGDSEGRFTIQGLSTSLTRIYEVIYNKIPETPIKKEIDNWAVDNIGNMIGVSARARYNSDYRE